jgi:hypothetical protein
MDEPGAYFNKNAQKPPTLQEIFSLRKSLLLGKKFLSFILCFWTLSASAGCLKIFAAGWFPIAG